jgi:thioredoxin 1
MSEEITVTKGNFEAEVMNSTLPVLADFWAEWCGPCRVIEPMLRDIAKTYADKIKIAKINADQEPDLALKFNVNSLPTLMIFKNGRVVKQQIGALPRPMLEKMIKEVV